jgi:NAD(P)-dependent dehydrogenase (short-subunit alcohol dehydrogenase family)
MTHHLLDANRIPGRLRGRTALITGAGKRIGRALAIALAEEGVQIVAHDRKAMEQETNKVCSEVNDCGARSWKVLADLEKPEEYEDLINEALRQSGTVDILINNASLFTPGGLQDLSFKDLMKQVQVNAWAPFVLSREFSRRVQRGKIVNLLDTRVAGYERTHAAYLLSKKMLATLTRMCAVEFAPGITVNAVAPGAILPPAGKGPEYLQELAQGLPLKRHGAPQDIVDAVIYLLGSDFVTGQVLYVDGGKHLLEEGAWTGS